MPLVVNTNQSSLISQRLLENATGGGINHCRWVAGAALLIQLCCPHCMGNKIVTVHPFCSSLSISIWPCMRFTMP